jgi:hypothetical protein
MYSRSRTDSGLEYYGDDVPTLWWRRSARITSLREGECVYSYCIYTSATFRNGATITRVPYTVCALCVYVPRTYCVRIQQWKSHSRRTGTRNCMGVEKLGDYRYNGSRVSSLLMFATSYLHILLYRGRILYCKYMPYPGSPYSIYWVL